LTFHLEIPHTIVLCCASCQGIENRLKSTGHTEGGSYTFSEIFSEIGSGYSKQDSSSLT
jgi:hypothetical protein